MESTLTSAVADLVAICHECAKARDDNKIQQLRDRVVEIGKRLNEQGGMDLMQQVCNEVNAILAKKRIYMGRWIDSVWDGIGEWRG